MKKMIILLTALILSPLFSHAQGISNGGKISSITSRGDILLFSIKGNKESERPTCATTKKFAITGNSTHAPLIIAAFNNNNTLGNVRGLGSCSQTFDAEDLKWIEVIK